MDFECPIHKLLETAIKLLPNIWKKYFLKYAKRKALKKNNILNLWQWNNGIKMCFTHRCETCGNFFRTDSLQVPWNWLNFNTTLWRAASMFEHTSGLYQSLIHSWFSGEWRSVMKFYQKLESSHHVSCTLLPIAKQHNKHTQRLTLVTALLMLVTRIIELILYNQAAWGW